MSFEIEPAILEKYIEIQAATKCRKCKKTDWALREKRDIAMGGDRVGIFVVLGSARDEVVVIKFDCKGCGAEFPRPAYSRAQLAEQEFPAVQLDVSADEKPAGEKSAKKTGKLGPTGKTGKITKKHAKGENGTQA